MSKFLLAFGLCGIVMSAACASAQAKVPVERPNLDVPAPPPRVIEPAVQEMAPPEPVAELPPAPSAPRPQRAQPPREPARPDPKPEAAIEPPPQSMAPAPPITPAPILRTPGTADTAGASRQVREVLDRTRKGLESIDYRRLSRNQRTQYDSAKRLVTESEEAFKASNFEISRSIAEKAEALVKELQNR